MDMTIDCQCADIKLTSPVYFIKDASCHVQFPQQVNSKSIMKINFITGADKDTFGGALLYRLQRKKKTSISTQLLVIWGYDSIGPYSYTLVIEHESTLVWNEDKLKRLYDVYNSQHRVYFNSEKWLLDGNTRLNTYCRTLHGGFEMDISIHKRESNSIPKKPLWVDPNK
jgi:hypothetical protein